MIQVRQLRPGCYALEDERVRQFLFTGGGEALLIDTGFPDSHVAETVRRLVSGPVRVVLTHGDMDHTGGVGDFPCCYLHPADWAMAEGARQLLPLREGDMFSCGDWRLEVIEIPGHTPGSVALFDRAHRLLLPGDSVQKDGPIFLFGAHRDVPEYIRSLRKLLAWRGRVDEILPCHHDCPIDPGYLEKNLEDAVALEEGRLPWEPNPELPCAVYRGRWTQFFGEPPERGREPRA